MMMGEAAVAGMVVWWWMRMDNQAINIHVMQNGGCCLPANKLLRYICVHIHYRTANPKNLTKCTYHALSPFPKDQTTFKAVTSSQLFLSHEKQNVALYCSVCNKSYFKKYNSQCLKDNASMHI